MMICSFLFSAIDFCWGKEIFSSSFFLHLTFKFFFKYSINVDGPKKGLHCLYSLRYMYVLRYI